MFEHDYYNFRNSEKGMLFSSTIHEELIVEEELTVNMACDLVICVARKKNCSSRSKQTV